MRIIRSIEPRACLRAAVVVAYFYCCAGQSQEVSQPETTKAFDEARNQYKERQKKVDSLSLAFDLEITRASRNPINYNVNWDGDNLIVSSAPLVYVCSPERAFIVHRMAIDQPYSIRALTPQTNAPRTVKDIFDFEAQVQSFDEAFRPTKIPKFMTSYGGISTFSSRKLDSHRVLEDGRIRFDCSYTQNGVAKTPFSKGFGIIDPTADYNVVQYRFTGNEARGDQSVIDCIATYYPATIDIPTALIKTYRKHQQIPDAKRPDRVDEARFSNYRIEAVPKEKMTLAYYGLPDPWGTRNIWTSPAVIAGGLGVAAVAALLFYRRRQAKAVV